MIRRRTITSYVWNSVSGNKMVILSNCIRNFFRKFELLGNSMQGENPAPDNPQEIKSAGRYDESSGKYLLDVKVTGKNLFDINYFKEKSNLQTIQGGGFTLLGIICNVKPNTKYTLSARLAEVKYNLNIANKVTRYSLTSSPSRTLVSNADGTLYIGLFNATVNSINMDDFMQQYQNIQLEEGTIATDYEAYQEPQTLTLTSDRPITKWDKLVEQGGQYGWLYKHRNITFNGEEIWKIHSNKMAFYTEIADAKFQNSFCDKYRHKLSAWAEQEYGIYSDNNNAQKYFRPPHEGFEMNVDIWKAFLNKNPLTVIYESMSTEFIPLSESEQTQLRNLHSYNGTTHIMVDSGEIPCGINIEYKYKS